MLTPALVVLQLLTIPTSAEPERPHFLTPKEMFDRMEKSPVKYSVQDLSKLTDIPHDKLAEALWRPRAKRLDAPTVRSNPDGTVDVVPWTFQPESIALLRQAEPLLQAKSYPEAAALYRKALKVDPKNYQAHSSLGDCALYQHHADEALAEYEAAMKLNPWDYRQWFFKGDALVAMGRKEEALDAYATSLVLNPRNPLLLGKLQKSGLPIRGDLIRPQSFARKEDGGVSIYADAKAAPAWLAFALCKGLWLGEPSRRTEAHLDGVSWSTFEEGECLATLAAAYATFKEKKTSPTDPQLELLTQVGVEDHMLNELAVYELGSRLDPHVTLKLSDDQRQRLKKYVLKYVLGVTQH